MSKNAIKLLLVLLLAMALVVGCASQPAAEEPAAEEPAAEEPAAEEPAAEEPAAEEPAAQIRVGLVTDTGGIDDKSFNQGTWEGILAFAAEYGIEDDNVKYIQSESDADYIPNLSTFSDDELDLIVAPGFLFFDALTEVAALYPDQKYLLIDSVVEADNVASAVFAEHEGSFLVGIAAALKAQEAGEDTVAFLGGMDFDLIQRFEAGFEQGVWAVDPDMTVLVDYAGSFSDSQKGQTIASKFFDDGAYIVYHAAGGTGNGAIKEAKDRVQNGEDVWVIGVDKDQYEDGIYEGDKSVILTSMMKRVDVASYTVAEQVLNGEFNGGVLTFELSNDGVNIPQVNPNLKDEWVDTIMEYKAKAVSGEIEIGMVPSRLQ